MPDGFKIADAYVDVTARDHTKETVAKIDQGVTKGVENTSGKTKKSFGSMVGSLAPMAAGLGGAFAAVKISDFVKDSVEGWRDHQQVLSQTAAVIKSTGGAAGVTVGQMDDLSGKIESNTGVDGDNVLAGENMLLTFTNLKNGVGKGNDVFSQATQTLTDMSAATGGDMKSSAIQLGKALNDPIAGIGALTKVGVTFTDQQKSSIKAMVAHGNTMGAQKVILKELNKEFGGSAAAQETSSQKTAVAVHNLQDAIGSKLQPVIANMANFISQKVIPALTSTITWMSNNSAIVKVLGGAIGALVLVLATYKIGLMASEAYTKVVTVATKAWSAAQAVLNAVMKANTISLVIIALIALVGGLILAYNKVGWFRNLVNAAFKDIGKVAGWLWNNALKPAFDAISNHWKLIVTVMLGPVGILIANFRNIASVASWLWKNALVPTFNGIKSLISAVVSAVRTYINGWVAIFNGLASVAKSVFSAVSGAIGRMGSAISSAYNTVRGYVSNIVSAITSIPGKIAGVAGSMASAGSNLMHSFWNGLKSVFGGASDIAGSIKSAINGALGLPRSIGGWHLGPVTLPTVTFPAFADGGYFNGAGTGRSDSNLARISNGEFIVNARSTKNNRDLLDAINSGASIVGASGSSSNDNRPVTIQHLEITVAADDIQRAADVHRIIQEAAQMATTNVNQERF